MSLNKFKMLMACDDDHGLIIGHEDGRMRHLRSSELARWNATGLASDALIVTYVDISDHALPMLVTVEGEDLILKEYTFLSTTCRIRAAYSAKTKTWVVGRTTSATTKAPQAPIPLYGGLSWFFGGKRR